MIKELSELGKIRRGQKNENKWAHDAFKEEIISMVLTIKNDGSFVSLHSVEKIPTITEAIQRTSGKDARLLIDNCGYVLKIYDPESNAFKKKIKEKGEKGAHEYFKNEVNEKFNLVVARLIEVQDIDELQPVLDFYDKNKEKGIYQITQEVFLKNIDKKDRAGNIAFLIMGKDEYAHKYDSVRKIITNNYDKKQEQRLKKGNRKCAVCGKNKFPVGDFTHFPIKRVPGDKEPAGGRKLISYNGDNNPFESMKWLVMKIV